MEVAPLATDLEMLLGDFPVRLAAPMAARLPATGRTLPMREVLLAAPRMVGIFHKATVRVGQKHLQSHLQAKSGMRTSRLSGGCFPNGFFLRRLADKQRIPVPIGSQNGMGRGRHPPKGASQLDFQ